jgi:predicted ATP-grasp superfamily ATP-dependent carboligase
MSGFPIADTGTPVFVLQVGHSLAVRHRALPVARSAGRLGIDVHVVHGGRAEEPAALSRYVRGSLVVPKAAPPSDWLRNLRRIGQRLGRPLLVPIDDDASVLVDDHAEELSEHFLFPRRPDGMARLLSSKLELHRLCLRLGIPSPYSVVPEDADDAVDHAESFGYPIVLKRIARWVPSAEPGAPSVHIAADRSSLVAAYARMRSPREQNVLLQEYIPGPPASIWMLNAYLDADSQPLVAFTGRKLRQYPAYTGAATLGVCERNPTVEADALRLLREVGYSGIIDLGFRYDERDGRYKLLDVNPRIGATFRLFVGDGGLDVLRALYLDMTGQPVPSAGPYEGRRWIVEPLDLLSSYRYWRDGAVSPAGWLRSLRGVREAAWFAPDDPLPAFAAAASLTNRAGRRLGASNRVNGFPSQLGDGDASALLRGHAASAPSR